VVTDRDRANDLRAGADVDMPTDSRNTLLRRADVTCWKIRLFGPILAPELITMPLGCGISRPPPICKLIGISDLVIVDQKRWRRTATLEINRDHGERRPASLW
jgi:hypothetical protein